MGNATQSPPHSLARNWTQTGTETYRNRITGELINCHRLQASSEEELALSSSHLMRRVGLAHPNIPKLIYFCSNPSNSHLCSQTPFSTNVYLERLTRTLSHFL